DGRDPGANLDLLAQYTAGVDTGIPSNPSAVSTLTRNNTPSCDAAGSPDSGCTQTFLGTSTDPANTNAQTQVINPTPGNVSNIDFGTLLYPGLNGEKWCELQPW